MRSEFEKLPDVSIVFDGLHPTIIWFCETSNQYATSFSGFDNRVVWLNGAWYAFQEQQKNIDSLEPIRKAILWHIEDSELSGINNEYDQGWYDCLKMIHKYVLKKNLILPVDE